MQDLIRRLLAELGEDPAREGLLDTPKRVVDAYGEWFDGYDADVARLITIRNRLASALGE